MSGRADKETAYQAFFEQHYADLARLAYLITGDPNVAADLAADALVEIWRHWRRVTSADHPLGYARGVLANLARGWLRKQRRERLGLLRSRFRNEEFHGPDVPAVLDVRAALSRLPLRRRECVILRYAFDVSEKEVAAILGISVGAVKSHTSRGADQLAAMLTDAAPKDDGPTASAAPLGADSFISQVGSGGGEDPAADSFVNQVGRGPQSRRRPRSASIPALEGR